MPGYDAVMRSPWSSLALLAVLSIGCGDDSPPPAGGSSSTGEEEGSSTTMMGGSGQVDGTEGEAVCVSGSWSGILRRGSAWTSFTECGTAETWWLESAPEGCDDVYLTVMGTLCGPGEYGLQGAYAFTLSGIVSEGPCTTDACDGAPTACTDTLCQLKCDLWAQDCPEGQKCIPVTQADAEPPWDGTSCVLLDATPDPAGAACVYNGLADGCEMGWWCQPDAMGADMGTCVQLCQEDMDCTAGTCTDCDGANAHEFGACDPPVGC